MRTTIDPLLTLVPVCGCPQAADSLLNASFVPSSCNPLHNLYSQLEFVMSAACNGIVTLSMLLELHILFSWAISVTSVRLQLVHIGLILRFSHLQCSQLTFAISLYWNGVSAKQQSSPSPPAIPTCSRDLRNRPTRVE